ncbi:MAG TPA: hypothetical protein DCP92_09015 [Nitrospiraceae bacterium]|jgi:predicted nucleotidyltransferase|nr:hypothetical protein [Nitrospiraceae bacterium]
MKNPNTAKASDCLFQRNDVIAAYLFGSRVSGKAGTTSDVDIAVLLDDGVPSGDYGFIRLEITTRLIELLSFDGVDVTILNVAPPLLSHEVLKRGMVLFSKDERKRIEYTAKATMRYLDTHYLRRVQDRILHDKIKRGDFGYFKGSHKYSIEAVRKGPSGTPAG